jgi:hypothetical protein
MTSPAAGSAWQEPRFFWRVHRRPHDQINRTIDVNKE